MALIPSLFSFVKSKQSGVGFEVEVDSNESEYILKILRENLSSLKDDKDNVVNLR